VEKTKNEKPPQKAERQVALSTCGQDLDDDDDDDDYDD